MAEYIISTYTAAWNFEEHVGTFVFSWRSLDDTGIGLGQSNWLAPVHISDPAEFQVMIDLLRNESPVMYDDRTKKLIARWERAGEGENAIG